MRILVTGSAGFVGYHVATTLLEAGHTVVGLDGLTPYYDVALKNARHRQLALCPAFTPLIAMLEDEPALARAFSDGAFDVVIHLAAQAGVRYSIENPRAYVDSNLVGTFNLLEQIRRHPVRHLMLASTSSVYGANTEMPFREADRAAHPMTLYAASKLAAEHMAHSYSHLFAIPVTAFRFFTVYGPWGRPDMAYFKFTQAILEGRPIEVFNSGRMSRDFTYVGDLVQSLVALMDLPPRSGDPGDAARGQSPVAPYRVLNLGRGQPVGLLDFIAALERALGRSAIKTMLPMQPGDVPHTYASTEERERLTGRLPETPLDVGIGAFVDWYRNYYRV